MAKIERNIQNVLLGHIYKRIGIVLDSTEQEAFYFFSRDKMAHFSRKCCINGRL